MKLAEILDPHPLTASPADSAGHAWESMKAAGAAYLVVIHDGEIVGVVSRSDLGGPSGGAHRRMGRRIGDLMQRKVAIVKPGTSVRRAAKLMRRQGLGCLPVQKGDKLVGVVTEAELLRVLERLLAK